MDINDYINESADTFAIPFWMAVAIQKKDPHMTVGLANSKLYRLNAVDLLWGNTPEIERLNEERN